MVCLESYSRSCTTSLTPFIGSSPKSTLKTLNTKIVGFAKNVKVKDKCHLFNVGSLQKSAPGMDGTAYFQQSPLCVSLPPRLYSIGRYCLCGPDETSHNVCLLVFEFST